MPYQAMLRIVATVSVCCEACRHEYAYEKEFKAYGSHSDQFAATRMAEANREGVYNWQTKRLAAGNYSSMVRNIPCPQCGYVQSWMVEPLRRRTGWLWGGILGALTFFLAIPASFMLDNFLQDSALSSITAGIFFVFIFVLPLMVLFAVRALVLKTYHPNKQQTVSPQRNVPTVSLHKSLI